METSDLLPTSVPHCLLHQGVGLGQGLEAVGGVAQVVSDLRQHGAKVWDVTAAPVARQAVIPGAPVSSPASPWSCGQRPPTQARSTGFPVWKALRGRERHSGLCLLVHGRPSRATR